MLLFAVVLSLSVLSVDVPVLLSVLVLLFAVVPSELSLLLAGAS